MHNGEWTNLFRTLPPETHSQMILVLNNRVEVTVEIVLRVEPAFLLVRGRMSGTTDGGLAFVVPYDQLAAFYLSREIKETEVASIFGEPGKQVAALARSANDTERPAPQVIPVQTPAAQSPASNNAMPAFGRPPEATAVARNNLLERLRAARQAAMPAPPQNGK